MNRRRSGYALVELMVVLTIIAVVLTLCAGTIHLLLKLDRSGRLASDEASDLARLARDFRADVHASGPVNPPVPPSDHLTLAIDGGRTVDYQVRAIDIVRTVRKAGTADRFEVYRRPSRVSVAMKIAAEGDRIFATMVVDRPSDGRDDSLYRDYRIVAELGKDRRLNPRAE